MRTLSEKNLKKSTRTLYNYRGQAVGSPDTTKTTGTDPTNTSVTITTTSHFAK